MPATDPRDRIEYLATTSRAGLGDALLRRLDRGAKIERELRAKVRELAEELAWCLFIELLRDHGEALAEALGSPRRRPPLEE